MRPTTRCALLVACATVLVARVVAAPKEDVEPQITPMVSFEDELEGTPAQSGPAAQQERLEARLAATEQRLFADYRRALQAAGWNRLLEPARVASDVSGKQANAIIVRARKAQRQYAANVEAFYASVPRQIKANIADPNRRSALLEVAQLRIPRQRARFLQLQDFELRAFDEIEAWWRWLHDARSRWHVADGQFVFNDAADRDTWGAHAESVQALIRAQTEAQTVPLGGSAPPEP